MSGSLNDLYRVVGISKQAVHQMAKRDAVFNAKVHELLAHVDALRKEHPGCGMEKMYFTLKPDFLGRDRFIELMTQLGYRVKTAPNYQRTTYPGYLRYPNLIDGLVISSPYHLWQSDITYIRSGERFYYAVFIIDVYTREIVGHNLCDHLRSHANIKALRMALGKHPPPQIHHSDRGVQYTSNAYTNILKERGIQLSMGRSPQENAYAERINRTIKEEYLYPKKINNYSLLRRTLNQSVSHYNNKRLHSELKRLTPLQYRINTLALEEHHRPSMTIHHWNH